MPIKACQGCLKDRFLTTTEALNCFTGKQLWAWGQQAAQYQGAGAVGDGSVIGKSSPVQTVSGGTNWRCVDANFHSIALKTDGTLWGWGSSVLFAFPNGDNANTFRSSPVQTVSGGTNWKSIAAGYHHSIGIKEVEF